jgi:PAS domain S-box-containing protein
MKFHRAPWRSLRTRVTLFTLSIILVAMVSLALHTSRSLRADMQTQLGEQQFFVLSILAEEINQQLGDRRRELEKIAAAITPALLQDRPALQRFMAQRELLQSYFGGGSFVTGIDGIAVASVPKEAERLGLSYLDRDYILAALKQGKSSVGRPAMGKSSQAPGFGMAAPIRDAQGRVIGVLTGVIDLSQPNFLQKITATRDGHTGDYVLISAAHRMIVTASDKSRILEQLPAAGSNLSIDRAISGFEGSTVMHSLPGVQVLASVKGIPEASWILASLWPTAQAFAPVYRMQQQIFLAALLTTLLTGLLTWWLLKREFSPMLQAAKTLSDPTRSQRPLPIRREDEIGTLIAGVNRLVARLAQREKLLMESQERFRTLLDRTREAIAVHCNGIVVYANHATLRMFGLGSEQEALGRNFLDFVHPDSQQQVRALAQGQNVAGEPAPLFEEKFIKSGGTAIDVEVQASWVVYDGELALQVAMRDITAQKHAEQQLRIAAAAFECQESMVVLDADRRILRVNQAFTRTTGFTMQEVQGQTTALLHSARSVSAAEYWLEVQRSGAAQGEVWHRRKDGSDYLARGSVSAIRDANDAVTHYVINFIDSTSQQQLEQQRQLEEVQHRNALVREVHHRIKNNLQGVIGILNRSAHKHPEMAGALQQAIGQVHAIAVSYGMQGQADNLAVHLGPLTRAIASENQAFWQTSILFAPPAPGRSWRIAEAEAVPIALVLNELILNAVKHRGAAQGPVQIELLPGAHPGAVQVRISNPGQFTAAGQTTDVRHSGLQLVAALLPRRGAKLFRVQTDDQVVTVLELEPPVVLAEKNELLPLGPD